MCLHVFLLVILAASIIMIDYTLPETNIAPENGPSQKETSLPIIHFQVLLLLVSGRVIQIKHFTLNQKASSFPTPRTRQSVIPLPRWKPLIFWQKKRKKTSLTVQKFPNDGDFSRKLLVIVGFRNPNASYTNRTKSGKLQSSLL